MNRKRRITLWFDVELHIQLRGRYLLVVVRCRTRGGAGRLRFSAGKTLAEMQGSIRRSVRARTMQTSKPGGQDCRSIQRQAAAPLLGTIGKMLKSLDEESVETKPLSQMLPQAAGQKKQREQCSLILRFTALGGRPCCFNGLILQCCRSTSG